MPAKLIGPQATHKQSKYQYREQSLTKAEPQGGGAHHAKCHINIILGSNISKIMGKMMDNFIPFYEIDVAISCSGEGT